EALVGSERGRGRVRRSDWARARRAMDLRAALHRDRQEPTLQRSALVMRARLAGGIHGHAPLFTIADDGDDGGEVPEPGRTFEVIGAAPPRRRSREDARGGGGYLQAEAVAGLEVGEFPGQHRLRHAGPMTAKVLWIIAVRHRDRVEVQMPSRLC